MTGERDRLLSEGMDDYLTKPIDEKMLLQVLNKWVPVRNHDTDASLDFVAPNEVDITSDEPSIQPKAETETNLVIDWGA
ncbi:hypothetical protein, partial [Vibrio alfacsensis]